MIDFEKIIKDSMRQAQAMPKLKETPNATPYMVFSEILIKYSACLLANYHQALREELRRQGVEIQ